MCKHLIGLGTLQTVEIVCWGFQPSMYFIREGGAIPCIGDLLLQVTQKGVKVRILSWDDPLPVAEWSENNAPGMNLATLSSKIESKDQLRYDRWWHVMREAANTESAAYPQNQDAIARGFGNIHYVTRGFSIANRIEIAYRIALTHHDAAKAFALSSEPTHHQKSVMVDYEVPANAVGFLMGHNMLDAYWDRDDHSAIRHPANMGRNGETPRHDISSKIKGPNLHYLNANFCEAWKKATGEDLQGPRNSVVKNLCLSGGPGVSIFAHIVRTQSQEKKPVQDIKKMYLMAVKNATSYIFIENQYFRWSELADGIKAGVQRQLSAGRDPGTHGPIYLFVITNTTDEAISNGTVSTYEMMDKLGRADVIPTVAREERLDDLHRQVSDKENRLYNDQQTGNTTDAAATQAEIDKMNKQIADLNDSTKPILPVEIPGLKTVICSLVAPDSPADNWVDVYVHAKLMMIDDTFMTIGSANVNIRSMEVDSELNIYHERNEVTRPLRDKLWTMHTGRSQDKIKDAFKKWTSLISDNANAKNSKQQPLASLIGFSRTSGNRSRLD